MTELSFTHRVFVSVTELFNNLIRLYGHFFMRVTLLEINIYDRYMDYLTVVIYAILRA